MRVSKHMYKLFSISTTCRGVQEAEMEVKPTMSEKKMVTWTAREKNGKLSLMAQKKNLTQKT